jgi:ADP-heptose:LPS heptosyltransferase
MDSLIGKPIAHLLSSPVYRPDFQVRSILIIRPGGIGDALLLAPAINLLKGNYSDASITILAEKRNAGAFSLIPAVDKLFLYDRGTDLIHLICSRYDLVIDTEQWHRMSAVIARLVPSFMKIGFATNERRRLFTHSVPYSHSVYEAQSFFDLLEPIGIKETFDPSSHFLSIPETAGREIEQFSKSLQSPYVAIFHGASVKERRWNVAKFRALVNRLADSGISSVIIGGEEDKLSGDELVSGTNALNLSGKTSIAGTAALIAGSRLLVSADSGVLHIGVGLGVPTVSLFGAGIADKWAPEGERHKVINRNLPCSPCTTFGTTPGCSYDLRCLEEIDIEEVSEAVAALLFK